MNNKAILKKLLLLYFLLLLSGVAYYLLAYRTPREDFVQLLSLFSFLFAAYLLTYRFFSKTHFKYLLIAGILFRILLLFSVPNLSDDVYRFIWDGRLAANGINPFIYLPAEMMQMPRVTGVTKELFEQLNSPDYYTIYPPVLQGIFWLTAKLFPVNAIASIVFFKCIIFIAELGTVFLLIQLLKKLSLSKHLSLLYVLNPLVIIEVTGNVHFESVMIFFVMLSFLLLLKNNLHVSAVCLGLAIATKIVPALFLPLIVNRLGWKKGLMYSIITGITTLILFAIVFDIATIQHLLKSVDLFIQRFEFNASIYYVVRWIGSLLAGYNIIAFAGPLLSLMAAGIILFLSFRNKKISNQTYFVKALFIITTLFLFSTTVHPWYVCLPVAISIFTQYRYALVWSYTTTLSYYAYHSTPVKENLWLVGFGYLLVTVYAFWELRNKNNKLKNVFRQNL